MEIYRVGMPYEETAILFSTLAKAKAYVEKQGERYSDHYYIDTITLDEEAD
jgi:hypothetical protein